MKLREMQKERTSKSSKTAEESRKHLYGGRVRDELMKVTHADERKKERERERERERSRFLLLTPRAHGSKKVGHYNIAEHFPIDSGGRYRGLYIPRVPDEHKAYSNY
jgi:hypothetical protein